MGQTADYEKLGQFYLGREVDPQTGRTTAVPLLYDSKDLVTHAVCVGMTGSGKTGLCIGLLEEAAIDGIPAIVIDPKGDLSNLLLTFPQLRPEDFRPWINEDDARRKGLSPDDFAAAQAKLWATGLAEWEQDGSRISRLRDSAEFVVYTPGSSAGVAVSILESFAAPPAEIVEDGELFRERVSSTATSLLGLLKIEADPLQSREHILISAILGEAWAAGRSLDLPALIQRIQHPPMQKLGVMELESVFPAKERFGLAMSLNTLVASPGFGAWTEGVPLDIQRILYARSGKPSVAIFSIAHLGDAERMFFVSLLLNQVLGWVRTQAGTTSLRAIVYMDEIAGYFPPVSNPPSKQPLLTLMKQARAFGVGVVLCTQNPVDLDYKGLSNAGTWLLGRLQTDRDKQRVLDGLETASAQASAAFDRAACDRLLSSLQPRCFLMNNVHDAGPVVLQSRWALSYLRGPLTRQQIRSLMDPVRARLTGESGAPSAAAQDAAAARPKPEATTPMASSVAAPPPPSASATTSPRAASAPGVEPAGSNGAPVLPPEIPQFFIPARAGGPGGAGLRYRPMLLASGKVYYQDTRAGVDTEVESSALVPFGEGPVVVDWDHAQETDLHDSDVDRVAASGASFDPLPTPAARGRSYEEWKKGFADHLFRTHRLEVLRSSTFKLTSRPGEDVAAFRARVAHAAREMRDAEVERLRGKFGPRLATLKERLRRAEQAESREREQAQAAKMNTAVSFGAAVLGAFLGRKTLSAGNVGRVASTARAGARAAQQSQDVDRAKETVAAVTQQLAELQRQFDEEVAALSERLDPAAEVLEPISLKPKRTNIAVRAVLLAWAPHDSAGRPAW